MGNVKVAAYLIAAFVIVALGARVYKGSVDEAAWGRVEGSLVRVRSGLKFESLFQLGPVLADADAAIAQFESTPRLLPLNHVKRSRLASKAITLLGEGVNWTPKPDETLDEISTRSFMAEQPEVVDYVLPSCSDGQVILKGSSVAVAFVELGAAMLETALDPQKTVVPRGHFDIAAATESCKQLEAQAKDQANRRLWASFRYRVDIALSNSSAKSCTFDLTVDHDQHSTETVGPGPGFEYGVQRFMALDSTRCDGGVVPENAIRFRVNGKPASPVWAGGHTVLLQ
jgi:hypothetical protein